MSYMHVKNLYADTRILEFKRCYALEKVHGTSGNVNWNEGKIKIFSGGENYERAVLLFDIPQLEQKFLAKFGNEVNVTVFGEFYGGKQQGMSKTYGTELKFVAFEVKVGENWLSVPQAAACAESLGFEFVDWVEIPTRCDHEVDVSKFETKDWIDGSGVTHRSNRLCYIDHERDKPSTQAIRNGITEPRLREGVVLRPPFEVTLNNGERLLAKHKRDEFRETSTKREVDPSKAKLQFEASQIADEYVVEERLNHVISRLLASRDEKTFSMKDTGEIVKLMIEDVNREGEGEFEPSKFIDKAIGTKTVQLFKKKVTQIK